LKIRIFSDLHIDCGTDVRAIKPGDEDVVVCAGDMCEGLNGALWLTERFSPKPIIYVPGNHEYYNQPCIEEVDADLMTLRDIHVLQNSSVEIDGIKFIGSTLWSNFLLNEPEPDVYINGATLQSMRDAEKWINDFHQINSEYGRRLSPRDTVRLFGVAVKCIGEELRGSNPNKTVVVTHFAPHPKSIATRFVGDTLTPYFVNNLPEVMIQHAALWIHGHTHSAFDYMVGNTRVVCNPGGYRREHPGFDSNLVIEI
jgi:Icc-related predicted phosphoesterase